MEVPVNPVPDAVPLPGGPLIENFSFMGASSMPTYVQPASHTRLASSDEIAFMKKPEQIKETKKHHITLKQNYKLEK